MKRIALCLMFLSCVAVAQQQKSLLDLRRVGNDSTYTAVPLDIVKTNTYTFITNTIGEVHGVLRARVLFKNQLSGYLVLDSVHAGSGLTRYTTSVTGDSLMNVWLPDDDQGLAEEELKVLRGWQVILTFETESSGNTGTVLVVTSAPTAFTPAPTPDLYVRLQAFTDTLNKNVCRNCGTGGLDTSGAWLEVYVNKVRDSVSVANKQAWTADGKAIGAQSTANTATDLAHQAMTRARIDSVLNTAGDVDMTAIDAIHPDVIIATVADVSLYLPDLGGLAEPKKFLIVNANDGDTWIKYSAGQDPDGGTDDDTVTAGSWQFVVADLTDTQWRVIRSDGSTDTTGFFAAYGGVMVESDPFINDSLDRNPRIPTMLRGMPVVSVMEFVRSDTSHSWTLVFQNALDSCKGKILYVPAGTYEFSAQGECPYEAGKEYILDFGSGNTTLWVSPGATLKLNAGLQVDSAVNFLVWKDARDIFIGGGGTIMLNASNQPGWVTGGGATWASDNGYCQGEAGNIIDGYQTGTEYDMSSNITVENLTLKDCFSNPIDIHGASHSMIRNIRSWSFGEGPQFVRGKNVVMDNIFVSDKHEPPYWTAGGVGDGIECAACIDFVIANCVIRDYQSSGGIDISYSRKGVVSNCLVDSAAGLLGSQSPLGNYWGDDVAISNCVVTKAGGHAVQWTSPGSAVFSNIFIDSVASGAAGFYIADNLRPVYLTGCTVRSAEYGVYTTNGLIEISGCSFDSVAHGVVMGRGADNQAPVVHITGSRFHDCSVAGVQINAAGDATYDARGSVTASSFSNCPYMPIRWPNAVDADSLNIFYQYHDVDGNTLRTNAPTWGTDSTVLTRKGYVDGQIAGLASIYAKIDSLNNLVRPGALTSALASYILKDTASLAVLGDLLYARTGGSGITTVTHDTLSVQWASAEGVSSAARNTWAFHVGRGTGALNFGWNTSGYGMISSIVYGSAWKPLAIRATKIGMGSAITSYGDSTVTIGSAASMDGLHVYGGGLFHGGIGTGGQAPRIGRRLDVVGAAAVSDTLRVGDFTTFTYVVPGGDPVKSSTAAIKRNIVPVDTLPALLERFISVNPVRYQFKPVAFRTAFDTSMADGRWWSLKTVQKLALRDSFLVADSTRAETLAQRQMIGFLAEDLHAAGFTASGREYGNGELLAVLWRVVQRLAIRHRNQQSEIDDLKARVKALEAKR